jgi:hypothetical protein
MRLERQVCSLELAKRLKELGVKQESLFFYWRNVDGSGSPTNPYEKQEGYLLVGNPYNIHPFDEKYSAFTVAELGEMLPEYKEGYKCVRTYWDKNKVGAEIGLRDTEAEFHSKTHFADTEADARAKMLIYLLENKFITPSSIEKEEV